MGKRPQPDGLGPQQEARSDGPRPGPPLVVHRWHGARVGAVAVEWESGLSQPVFGPQQKVRSVRPALAGHLWYTGGVSARARPGAVEWGSGLS